MEESVRGGCLCGAVRFEVQGQPKELCLCHCTMCRRAFGATPVAWATFPFSGWRQLGQPPAWFRSSEHADRGFCPTCGASLFFVDRRLPDEVDIATAALDAPERFPPDHHIWVPSAVPWALREDGLPRHEEGSGSRVLSR